MRPQSLHKIQQLSDVSLSDSWNSDTGDGSNMQPGDSYMPNFNGVEVNDTYDRSKMELDGTYNDKLIWNFN